MNETIKYKILASARYLGDAFFYPFFSRYLFSTGLAEARIGFLLSITPIIAIILNPVYSALCSNTKKTRNILKIITVLEGFAILGISLTTNFYLITILVFLMAIFGSCHYGLMDSLTTVYATQNKINYSSIRIFGSSAYIIATTVGGYIIDGLGYKTSFWIATILFITTGFLYQLLTPLDLDATNEKPIKDFDIIKNKKYIFFVIFYVFLVGTTYSSDCFFSTYLESRGLLNNQFGLVYSFFVLFEVITLFILNRFFKKTNTEVLLIISCLCLIVRSICNYLYLPMIVVILFSSLRGIGFALILHTCYQYVVNIVGSKKGTFAIMLMTLFYSLYVAVFNNIFGNIIEKYSYKSFYLLTILLGIIALVLGIVRLIIVRKQNKSLIINKN